MKEFPWIASLLMLGNIFLILLMQFGFESYYYQTTMFTINESVKVAGLNNIDRSARVDESLFLIGKPAFEAKFIQLYKNDSLLNTKDATFSFDYLEEAETIKAIYIEVIARGKSYSVTYLVDNTQVLN